MAKGIRLVPALDQSPEANQKMRPLAQITGDRWHAREPKRPPQSLNLAVLQIARKAILAVGSTLVAAHGTIQS
jgi:hypothetical protein